MKVAIIISAFFLFSLPVLAEDTIVDREQEQLALYFNYSKLLDSPVDSISQPELFKTIYEWLGTPYHYSGSNKDGIDCSGFVCMLYKKVYDLELAESSHEIFDEVKTVKKNNIETGDLVFFKIRKKRISHVGVYLGNNKFAHATVHEGVIISDLDEPYYKKYFYKAGRMKNLQ